MTAIDAWWWGLTSAGRRGVAGGAAAFVVNYLLVAVLAVLQGAPIGYGGTWKPLGVAFFALHRGAFRPDLAYGSAGLEVLSPTLDGHPLPLDVQTVLPLLGIIAVALVLAYSLGTVNNVANGLGAGTAVALGYGVLTMALLVALWAAGVVDSAITDAVLKATIAYPLTGGLAGGALAGVAVRAPTVGWATRT